MKIIYIVNDMNYFRAHREKLALKAHQKHDVTVVSGYADQTELTDWPEGMALVRVNLNRHALDPVSDLKFCFAIRRIIAEIRPDIVHAITIKPILFGGLAAAVFSSRKWREKARLVWTFPGLGKVFEPSDRIYNKLRRQLIARSLRFVAKRLSTIATFENNSDRDTIVDNGILPAEHTYSLMGAGIDFNAFGIDIGSSGRTQPDRHFDASVPITFLMASRLINGKGVNQYLRAVRTVRESMNVQARFLLAGIDEESNPDAVDKNTIWASVERGDIEFIGAVPQNQMADLLGRCDVFCLPTLLREGFPRSLIEAAASGCALIATDQESVRPLVNPGKTGWLLSPPIQDGLEKSIVEAAQNPALTRRFGISARKLIQQLPVDEETINSEFMALYERKTLLERG